MAVVTASSRQSVPVTRVIVVDDSPTMRRLIVSILSEDPRIDVVATASEPNEARAQIKEHMPDVITLDVEMPGMDGIEFLKRIMKLRPMPVIMVSTLTHHGTAASVEALSIGAVDCVGKPASGNVRAAFSMLADKIVAARSARLNAATLSLGGPVKPPVGNTFDPNNRLVVIGASTGGVSALSSILARFPENCPPTLIVQHMPAGFTRNFSERLARTCRAEVAEACDGDVLKPGCIYVAPGGEHHMEIKGRARLTCSIRPGPTVTDHRPSIDVLFRSAIPFADRTIAVLLTGMGRDGAEGMLALRNAGARTIGQDEKSSVVYGMARVAAERNAVEHELPLGRIPGAILEACANG